MMLKLPFLLLAVVVRLSSLLAVADAASCESTYGDNKIYSSTFVIQTRDVFNLNTGANLPMEAARNTKEYRELAFAFFAERYNLIFDPDVEGAQYVLGPMAPPQLPGLRLVGLAGWLGPGYKMDVHPIPALQGRFPLTIVKVEDDGYFLTVLADFTVSGGTIGDVDIPANSFMSFGEYRFFDESDTVLLSFNVQTDVPAVVFQAVGAQKFRSIIRQTLSSDQLGNGTGYAH
jgi:hypothetical protein